MIDEKPLLDLIVVGGGASGFFAAIAYAESRPHDRILILEKSNKFLSKVAISGGGRCNVTHDCIYPSNLVKAYPRGEKALKKGYERFGVKETMEWFEIRGVSLKVEADGRIFPITDQSKSVVNCLLNEAQKGGIKTQAGWAMKSIQYKQNVYHIQSSIKGESFTSRKVILAMGGQPKKESFEWAESLSINYTDPVPSLFTFNVPDHPIKELMGISVPQAEVRIVSSKYAHVGPLLITHWGFSGPAVIVLSAIAARYLESVNYNFESTICWKQGLSELQVHETFQEQINLHGASKVYKSSPFSLPERLWVFLCHAAEIPVDRKWGELARKEKNLLMENLIRYKLKVNGKTTYKEEFVTCGGIDLDEVNLLSFESKKYPGMFITGELLNVDGITGGYNFQHAWTSGFLAGKAAAAYSE